MQSPKLQRFLLASDKSLSSGCLFWSLFQCCFAAEWWDRLVALASWLGLGSRLLPPPFCFPCNAPHLICTPQIPLLSCLVLPHNNSEINNSNNNLMFRTSPCYGCCSKGSGFTRTFLYAKLYSVCHSSWWNLSLPPSLACRVTVAASLPPIFLSKYQSNTFLIFQQHLFPLSAIRSHRVSRGYLSLFQ